MGEHGQNARNFHAHVMLTLRQATPDGLHAIKTREWNSCELLKVWRAEWAVECNRALERAGQRVRVDHRTLEAQRDEAVRQKDMARAVELNREPEIHVGPKARQMVRHQRPPVSRVREVNAYRRPAGRPASTERRRREYPATDHGTRVTHLRSILESNDRQLKADLKAIERRFDRISQKMDYWERRTAFKLEGTIKGRQFRLKLWWAAQEEKQRRAEVERKAAHARKRLTQLRDLLKMLGGVLSTGSNRREVGLARAREIEGWMRGVQRLYSRRAREGKSRVRSIF